MKLSEMCEIKMGQSPESSTYNEEGNGLPFFQGNADFGKIHPSVRVWCSSPVKIAFPNDILISVRAPIGALNIADTKCCIGRGLAALTVNESVCNARYLWYALQSKVNELNAKGTGSTFKAINKAALADTEIPYVPLDKQKKIADIFDKLSFAIDKRDRQIEILNLLVKSRFVEKFGDYKTNSKGFEQYKGADLFKFSSGKFLKEEKRLENGIAAYGGNGIAWYTDEPLIDYPTIIIGRVGALCGNIHMVKEPVWITDNAIYIKEFKTDKFTLEFLNEIMKMMNFYQYADFSGQPKITQKPLENLLYIVPPKQMQNEFTNFVFQTDKSKYAVKKSLEKLETLKKALMQEYFG